MASAEAVNGSGEDHVVEMVVISDSAAADAVSEEITPLLTNAEHPKIDIFSVSYPRKRPREQVTKLAETEISLLTRFLSWSWGGSRYSGLTCMALSSTAYFTMEILVHIFSVQSIPLFETAFTRCTITLILSYIWLKRTGQPLFGPPQVRKLLLLRAVTGYLSMLSFTYCIKRLPSSQAIVLSCTAPIMASILARMILHEQLKIAELGGLACSFFGVLFMFRPIIATQVELDKAGEIDKYFRGRNHIYAILIGLFSSITAGISYCLIRAGAKSSDQPVLMVFSFAILATAASAVCTIASQEFLLPGFYSFLSMVLLGVLAFLAEVFLARGLQLEKTSKVANVLYIEAALSQVWGMGSLQLYPSFGRLVGCLLILVSVCITIYRGSDREIE